MGPPTEETQSLTVDCLISPSSADSDREKIKAILPDLEQEILDIKLSKKGAIDTFVWLPTKTGIFSAKSGYYESIKINNSDAPLPPPATREFNWSEYIWHLKTSPKNKLLLRKAVRGALSSRENLRARSINIEGQCPFCGSEETSIHLFFTCPFAVQVWKAAPFKNQLPQGSIHSIRDFIEKAKILVCLPPSGVGHGPLFPWIFWAIWNTRNHKIFNSKPTSPEETLTRAIALGREWCEAQESETPPQPRLTQTSPTYAGSDMIICNVDAAWQKETKTAGCGWIFRNEAIRQHCIGSATSLWIRSPLIAEAVALLHAIQDAHNLGFQNLSVASDCKQLIEAIHSENPPKELHRIIFDILQLSSSFSHIKFSFVARSCNREADALAKQSLQSLVPDLV